jgi:hypothetical protein
VSAAPAVFEFRREKTAEAGLKRPIVAVPSQTAGAEDDEGAREDDDGRDEEEAGAAEEEAGTQVNVGAAALSATFCPWPILMAYAVSVCGWPFFREAGSAKEKP